MERSAPEKNGNASLEYRNVSRPHIQTFPILAFQLEKDRHLQQGKAKIDNYHQN
ncbi:MAG: hypothetical protein PVI20_14795 [Desulfobacteraceae bacterium]|jgi:hypothetical protein